jgi:hypothetical protein
MQDVGRADVLLYFKCPTTKKMRCHVNAYKKTSSTDAIFSFPALEKTHGVSGDVGIAQARECNMYLLRSHNDIE